MDEQELRQRLEFEYWGYHEALKQKAEEHGFAFEPFTMRQFFGRRGVELDDEMSGREDTSLENPRLKRCPFCKAKPKLSAEALGNIWYQVLCRCGVGGPMFSEHRHLAVQGWNRMVER